MCCFLTKLKYAFGVLHYFDSLNTKKGLELFFLMLMFNCYTFGTFRPYFVFD